MSADEASNPGGASVSPAGPRGTRPVTSVWITMRSRAVELVIVFAGVYAAFLLNRLDTERHDARRHAQLIGALEREISGKAAELKGDLAEADKALAGFNSQLAAGEMPHLGISYVNSSYSAVDDATLLQAGGLDLLDMQTIELTHKVNALERELDSATHNQFEVCLAELANHRNEDFYDPATRQLKPEYKWYPGLLHTVIGDAKTLLAAEEALVTHLRSIQPAGTRGQP